MIIIGVGKWYEWIFRGFCFGDLRFCSLFIWLVVFVDGFIVSYENLVLDENSKNLIDKFECFYFLFVG